MEKIADGKRPFKGITSEKKTQGVERRITAEDFREQAESRGYGSDAPQLPVD